MPTQSNRRLLAVDGPSIFHRAYHAYGPRDGADPMTTKDGTPVWAVYGFFALLAGICDKVNPSHLIVGFDDKENARALRYPLYKSQRAEKADDLRSQLATVVEILTELGVSTVTPAGLEADDVMATAAKVAEDMNGQCVIATSDRDSFALITDNVTVLRLKNGLNNADPITPARLVELYNVAPNRYLDFAALRGDPSDNLDGVDGIGVKTAAKLLEAMSASEAYADPEKAATVIGKSYAAKLAAGIENYERNIDIMSLHRDIPLDLPGSGLGKVEADKVAEILRRRELPSLAGKVQRALRAVESSPANVPAQSQAAPAPIPVQVPQQVIDDAQTLQSTSTIPGTSILWPVTL